MATRRTKETKTLNGAEMSTKVTHSDMNNKT